MGFGGVALDLGARVVHGVEIAEYVVEIAGGGGGIRWHGGGRGGGRRRNRKRLALGGWERCTDIRNLDYLLAVGLRDFVRHGDV